NGMTAIARWLQARPPAPPATLTDSFRNQCRDFASNCESLGEPQRFAFMASIGVPMTRSLAVATAPEALRAAEQLGLPVVLKGSAPDVLHKSEHGLVALGLADAKAVTAAFDDISAKLGRATYSPCAEVVVQSQAKPGIELIVGVRNHPGFGSLLVVGL